MASLIRGRLHSNRNDLIKSEEFIVILQLIRSFFLFVFLIISSEFK